MRSWQDNNIRVNINNRFICRLSFNLFILSEYAAERLRIDAARGEQEAGTGKQQPPHLSELD